MKAVDDAMVSRIERNEKMRALTAHERKSAELRSELGLLLREKYVSIDIKDSREPEVVRMRTDQIDRLFDAGKISQDQRAAALKFRVVWEAMGRGLFPSASGVGDGGGTKAKGSFRHPLERMNQREFFIWIHEYRPWANGYAAKTAIANPRERFQKSYLQLSYAVIIDNYGPNQLEQIWPVPQGKGVLTSALREGLSRWEHKDYEPTSDLEDIRRAMVSEARARIDEVHPRKSA